MTEEQCPNCGVVFHCHSRFCGNCGADMASGERNNTVYPQAVSKLIELIIMTMSNVSPSEKLRAFTEFSQLPSSDADKAIGWAMKVYSHAQLRQIDETLESQAKAREYYAKHLGLNDAQREKYLNDPFLTSPLAFDQNLELRMYFEEPHLVDLFESLEFRTTPNSFLGSTIEEKQALALETWARGAEKNELTELMFCSLLAFLYLKIRHYEYALTVFERITKTDLFHEGLGRPSYKLLWSNVLAGNCYDAVGKPQMAIIKWQCVRTYELMSEKVTFSMLLFSYWVNQAKHNLQKKGVAIPSTENTQKAAYHLSCAWQWLMRADMEIEDMDLTEMAIKVKDDGEDFRAYVAEAERELNNAVRLDANARCEVEHYSSDSEMWITCEEMKAAVHHKRGIIHLAFDNFDPAIVEFRQSLGSRSSLKATFFLGLSYDLKGLPKEAREIYQWCMTRSEEIAHITEDKEFQEDIVELTRAFLSNLPTPI